MLSATPFKVSNIGKYKYNHEKYKVYEYIYSIYIYILSDLNMSK